MSEQKIPAEMLDAAEAAIEKVRYDRGIGFLSSAEIAALVLSAAITGAEHVIASRQMELNQARGRITQLEKALLFVGARIEENGDTVMTCAAFNQWLKTEGDRLVRERIAELEADTKRLRWLMADIDTFSGIGTDRHEQAVIIAGERDRDEPNEADELDAFRWLIDTAMESAGGASE
jgi:acyl-coenzyme A synthetase/AMP-(fatty) acid ligase